jgi:hypothetical protein
LAVFCPRRAKTVAGKMVQAKTLLNNTSESFDFHSNTPSIIQTFRYDSAANLRRVNGSG